MGYSKPSVPSVHTERTPIILRCRGCREKIEYHGDGHPPKRPFCVSCKDNISQWRRDHPKLTKSELLERLAGAMKGSLNDWTTASTQVAKKKVKTPPR